MGGDLAEPASEVELLGRGNILVAEEDHPVGHQRGANRLDRRVIQRPGQVDAVDFRAEGRATANHVDEIAFGFGARPLRGLNHGTSSWPDCNDGEFPRNASNESPSPTQNGYYS